VGRELAQNVIASFPSATGHVENEGNRKPFVYTEVRGSETRSLAVVSRLCVCKDDWVCENKDLRVLCHSPMRFGFLI